MGIDHDTELQKKRARITNEIIADINAAAPEITTESLVNIGNALYAGQIRHLGETK